MRHQGLNGCHEPYASRPVGRLDVGHFGSDKLGG